MVDGHMQPGCADAVEALCNEAIERLPAGATRDGAERIRDRLREPLCIVLAGRVNAGKSTLVNALLRQRVAQTGVTETTRVTTRFVYGIPERLELELDGGGTREVALVDGRIPASFGVAPTRIREAVVYLSNALLRDVTLVDTPGLALGIEVREPASARAVTRATREALAEADAVVFLIPQVVREADAAALHEVQALLGGADSSPLTTIAVLGKADKIGGGNPDSAGAAAAELSRALGPAVSAVLPVIGLLAETAESGALGEREAHALERLAAVDARERQTMLLSADLFRTRAALVPAEDRERLLERLDLYGLARCLAAVDEGLRGAAALSSELRRLSGIADLVVLLKERFERYADVLKANAALAALERLSWTPPTGPTHAPVGSWLRDEIERIRLEPPMHRINEIRVLEQGAGAPTGLPEAGLAELRSLVAGSTYAERLRLPEDAPIPAVRAAALEAGARWNALVNHPRTSPAARQAGRVLARSYALLWAELRELDLAEAGSRAVG